MKKALNAQDKSEGEIMNQISEKREALRVFRFSIAGSQAKNVKEGRTLRKDIARLKTELRSRTV